MVQTANQTFLTYSPCSYFFSSQEYQNKNPTSFWNINIQMQVSPSIPFPEKIFINFPFSLGENKTKTSTKQFPSLTGLQTGKHRDVILELILNLELYKELPVCF